MRAQSCVNTLALWSSLETVASHFIVWHWVSPGTCCRNLPWILDPGSLRDGLTEGVPSSGNCWTLSTEQLVNIGNESSLHNNEERSGLQSMTWVWSQCSRNQTALSRCSWSHEQAQHRCGFSHRLLKQTLLITSVKLTWSWPFLPMKKQGNWSSIPLIQFPTRQYNFKLDLWSTKEINRLCLWNRCLTYTH